MFEDIIETDGTERGNAEVISMRPGIVYSHPEISVHRDSEISQLKEAIGKTQIISGKTEEVHGHLESHGWIVDTMEGEEQWYTSHNTIPVGKTVNISHPVGAFVELSKGKHNHVERTSERS